MKQPKYIDLVYVAGPYSADTDEQRNANIRAAWLVGCQVATLGVYPVIPHVNTAHMDKLQEQQWWLDATLELMMRCNAVLMMDNWKKSHGAKGEEAMAKKVGIPVFYDIASLAEWVAEQHTAEL